MISLRDSPIFKAARWITVHGTHVQVDDAGKVKEGPKNLTGKPVNNLPVHRPAAKEEPKAQPTRDISKLPSVEEDGYPSDTPTNHVSTNEIFKKTSKAEMTEVLFAVDAKLKKEGIDSPEDLGKLGTVQTVNVKELHSTQPTVERDKIESLLGPEGRKRLDAAAENDLPIVVRFKGEIFAWDGQHRIAAQSLQGKDEIKAHVVDLDAAPKTKKTFALRDSPIYRQKSKDASGHEHSSETGQFTSGGGGGAKPEAAKPSKPENKLAKATPVKAAAQEARETHQAAKQARDAFEKAKAAYQQALDAHREARTKHEEAKAARDEKREAKEMAKEKVKEEKYSARAAKLRAKIDPASRATALRVVAASKGTATDEEKRRGADRDMARIEDVAANLEKSGMSKQAADKLLSDLVKSEELDWMQTGQGKDKPMMTWVRIPKGGKPANNLPK